MERHRRAGQDISYIHRTNRSGFKAGALENGLSTAKGEFVAVFDADFVPAPDFLERTVPFFADPKVGMVQVRWGHLNREFSILTQAQSIFLDGHFVIEHTARNRSGCFFNFNGTAGIWRRDGHRRRRRLAARHAHRGPRPQLPRAAQGLAVHLPARGGLAGRGAGGHERLQEPAAPLGQGLHPDRAQAACRPSSGRTSRCAVKREAFFHLTNNIAYLLMVLLSVLMPLSMVVRFNHGLYSTLFLDLPVLPRGHRVGLLLLRGDASGSWGSPAGGG